MRIHIPLLTMAGITALGFLSAQAHAQHAHIVTDNGTAGIAAAAKAEGAPPPLPELRTAQTVRDQSAAIALAESISIQHDCRYPIPPLWIETISWYQGTHPYTGFNYRAVFSDEVLRAHARLALDYMPKARRCADGGSQVLGDEAAARLQREAYDIHDNPID